MNFSAMITVPHADVPADQAIAEQLLQDGFLFQDIHVPPVGTPDFSLLVKDAHEFADELVAGLHGAWPLRGVRWLNRLSTCLTGKLFSDLTPTQRGAISHAAITLAGHSELLA